MCASGRQQAIHFLWRPVLPDAHADLVLEVAVNGECDAIVMFSASLLSRSEELVNANKRGRG